MRKIVITKFNRNCCFLSYLKDVLDWFFILQILSKIQKKKKNRFFNTGAPMKVELKGRHIAISDILKPRLAIL